MAKFFEDLLDDDKKDDREKPYKMIKFTQKQLDISAVEEIKKDATTAIYTKMRCEANEDLDTECWGLTLNHSIRYE